MLNKSIVSFARPQNEPAAKAVSNAQAFHGALAIPPDMGDLRGLSINPYQMTRVGRLIRDQWWMHLPVIPAALTTFSAVSVGREWTITGKPNAAARAVEYLNMTNFRDINGIPHIGYTQHLGRKVMDWLCIGRMAFAARYINRAEGLRAPMQYVDPTYLRWEKNNDNKPGHWLYGDERFEEDEMFISEKTPIGVAGGFVAPMVSLLPHAMLAFFLTQHDTASLDGRRIRDIIFVADDNMKKMMGDAIKQVAAVWSGYNPGTLGVPLVAINAMNGIDKPVSDFFATMGLSNIPESFDRQHFMSEFFPNLVAATLELGLRYFWNDSTGTNRSLEQINEMRQTVKGPGFFIREEQRLINGSHILNKTVMSFSEEVDLQGEQILARIFETYAGSLKDLSEAYQTKQIPFEVFVEWMQRRGIVIDTLGFEGLVTYTEVPVDPSKLGGKPVDYEKEIMELPEMEANPDDEKQIKKEPKATQKMIEDVLGQVPRNYQRPLRKLLADTIKSVRSKSLDPEYDTVTVNSDGAVIARNVRSFHIDTYFEGKDIEPKNLFNKEYLKTVDELSHISFPETSYLIFPAVPDYEEYDEEEQKSIVESLWNEKRITRAELRTIFLNVPNSAFSREGKLRVEKLAYPVRNVVPSYPPIAAFNKNAIAKTRNELELLSDRLKRTYSSKLQGLLKDLKEDDRSSST
jgi:hypothetical protein